MTVQLVYGGVREVYTRMQEMRVKMFEQRLKKWFLSRLVFADDTALVIGLTEQLQCSVRGLGRVCEGYVVEMGDRYR